MSSFITLPKDYMLSTSGPITLGSTSTSARDGYGDVNDVIVAYDLYVSGQIAIGGSATILGIQNYPSNAAAKAAGLVNGALYHTDGVLKVVYT